jgi:8-oxo-dGTP pyrophosphatase MutT (NUDIX family)
MKIDFPISQDGQSHSYCSACYSEKIDTLYIEGNFHYRCLTCGLVSPRIIHIEPSEVWWIDEATRELWHESMGVFVFDQDKRLLLFERVIYPFVYTIPAGHLMVGESPEVAAAREVEEETGLPVESLDLVSEEDMAGDCCKWGADNHRWHLYKTVIQNTDNFTINAEGHNGRWCDINQALELDLTIPTRYFIREFFL